MGWNRDDQDKQDRRRALRKYARAHEQYPLDLSPATNIDRDLLKAWFQIFMDHAEILTLATGIKRIFVPDTPEVMGKFSALNVVKPGSNIDGLRVGAFALVRVDRQINFQTISILRSLGSKFPARADGAKFLHTFDPDVMLRIIRDSNLDLELKGVLKEHFEQRPTSPRGQERS